jgi:hypothetical protein
LNLLQPRFLPMIQSLIPREYISHLTRVRTHDYPGSLCLVVVNRPWSLRKLQGGTSYDSPGKPKVVLGQMSKKHGFEGARRDATMGRGGGLRIGRHNTVHGFLSCSWLNEASLFRAFFQHNCGNPQDSSRKADPFVQTGSRLLDKTPFSLQLCDLVQQLVLHGVRPARTKGDDLISRFQ